VATHGGDAPTAIGTNPRLGRAITMLGFNPLLQVMHEEDLAEALVVAVEQGLRGVYNVAGPGEVPLHTAIREVGARPLPLPEPLARLMIGRSFRLGWFPFPPGAIDYIKYTCTISGKRFAAETGFRPQYSLKEIFRSVRR
jgi:UDP-glucose 4-epimerase